MGLACLVKGLGFVLIKIFRFLSTEA